MLVLFCLVLVEGNGGALADLLLTGEREDLPACEDFPAHALSCQVQHEIRRITIIIANNNKANVAQAGCPGSIRVVLIATSDCSQSIRLAQHSFFVV